jgi:hypothetical protein
LTEGPRSIYRAAAVRRYAQGREQSVLPRFASPPTLICLWILLGLLLASCLVAWLARVPVYATGNAVVMDSTGAGQTGPGGVMVAAFLPAADLPALRAGQDMIVRLDERGEAARMPIVAVEPEISSPSAVLQRFGLQPGAAVSQPTAVALAILGPRPGGLPVSVYIGGIYPARVEVGSRRVVSLIPLLGRLGGE